MLILNFNRVNLPLFLLVLANVSTEVDNINMFRQRVRYDNPEAITLHEIDDDFLGKEMPPVIHYGNLTEEQVDERFRARMVHMAWGQLVDDIDFIRRTKGHPRHALGAMMMRGDDMTIPHIAALSGSPVARTEEEVGILVQAGWAQEVPHDIGPRYKLDFAA